MGAVKLLTSAADPCKSGATRRPPGVAGSSAAPMRRNWVTSGKRIVAWDRLGAGTRSASVGSVPGRRQQPPRPTSKKDLFLFHLLLVFAHLLAASMALGAIVATDLRLLSKLSQDRVRIAPPNEFVMRIVMVALLMLYVTGAGIVVQGLMERPDYLSNPKLQAKLLLVVLLTINAFVLHKITFPRLSKGRRVARWHAADWVLVAVPVALSNFLWMFTAFLGIARPWNYGVPMRDIFEIAAALYLIAQCGVFFILFMAGRNVEGAQLGTLGNFERRSLAALGSLGRPLATTEPAPRRRVRPPPKPTLAVDGEDESFAMTGSLTGRPSLRLVGQRGPVELKRRRVR